VASDVTANEVDSSRTFVILVNDVAGAGDLWAEREMKVTVTKFVEQLGPNDIAALVFLGNTQASQNFTRDKAKLVSAVNAYTRTAISASGASVCEPKRILPRTFLYIAQQLATLKGQRKAIVYLGGGVGICGGVDQCHACLLWTEAVAAANATNLTVYPIDTMGLRPSGGAGGGHVALANATGGRAVFNTNSFDEGVARIFTENSSYYLLAYQPTREPDGRFRRVDVKVNRPGVEVVATRQYQAPKPPKPGAKPSPLTPAEVEALAGLLPMSALPLRATAAPFAIPGSDGATVAIAVGLRQPGFASRTRDQVDLLIRSFTSDAFDRGQDRQLIPITVPAIRVEGEDSRYDVLARVDLPKPGSYELRFSVHSEATGARGSVYLDVDVPDFRKAPVSLSGVVLHSLSAPPAAPTRVLADVTPLAPTTERAFARDEIVTAFMRVYQGGTGNMGAATMKLSIRDGSGKSVFAHAEAIDAQKFAPGRVADYRVRLPLTSLTTGDHVFTVEATIGKNSAKRDVVFTVKQP
jgi:VWFA-related protein